MAKPLSRPNEIGRAIGYRVDVSLLLAWIKQAGDPAVNAPDLKRNWLTELERAADAHGMNATRTSRDGFGSSSSQSAPYRCCSMPIETSVRRTRAHDFFACT